LGEPKSPRNPRDPGQNASSHQELSICASHTRDTPSRSREPFHTHAFMGPRPEARDSHHRTTPISRLVRVDGSRKLPQTTLLRVSYSAATSLVGRKGRHLKGADAFWLEEVPPWRPLSPLDSSKLRPPKPTPEKSKSIRSLYIVVYALSSRLLSPAWNSGE